MVDAPHPGADVRFEPFSAAPRVELGRRTLPGRGSAGLVTDGARRHSTRVAPWTRTLLASSHGERQVTRRASDWSCVGAAGAGVTGRSLHAAVSIVGGVQP